MRITAADLGLTQQLRLRGIRERCAIGAEPEAARRVEVATPLGRAVRQRPAITFDRADAVLRRFGCPPSTTSTHGCRLDPCLAGNAQSSARINTQRSVFLGAV